MMNLSPAMLTHVYQFLDQLQDIKNASMTCRSWCWMLWRSDEQMSMWVPLIAKKLRNYCDYTNAVKKVKLAEYHLRRELGYRTREDVMDTYQRLNDAVIPESLKLARGLFLSGSMWKMCLRSGVTTITPAIQTVATNVFRIGSDHNCSAQYNNAYGELFCFRGQWNENFIDIKSGDMFKNGELIYSGQFENRTPHGYGVYYDNGVIRATGQLQEGIFHGKAREFFEDGSLLFDGYFENGQKNGLGTLYHSGSENVPQFHGTWSMDQAIFGTWYDYNGEVVHQGTQIEFATMVHNATFYSQCTAMVTRECYVKMPWYKCLTCYGANNDTNGVCVSCARRCHKGHELVLHEETEFFCDCGGGDCPVRCQAASPMPYPEYEEHEEHEEHN